MDIEILKEYVKIKHEGQKRKQGTPYYLHPFAVADILKEKGFNDDYQAAGLLHDTLEDTNATKEEILKLSFRHSSVTNKRKRIQNARLL